MLFQLEKARWFGHDDTALNAVSLKCVNPWSHDYEGTIDSMQGPWGEWQGKDHCDLTTSRPMESYFL